MACQVWIFFRVLLELRLPVLSQLSATLSYSTPKMFPDTIWNVEFRVFRPAVVSFGQPNFFFAQRFAMCGTCILLVRRAISDVAIHNDQCRSIFRAEKSLKGACQHCLVVRISNANHVPPITEKTGRHILTERPLRMTFDGDPIVVIDPAEIREF